MIVLGIETSCDETGIAIYSTDKGLLADALYSQVKLHADYGGVVPELASRDHIRKILPLIDQVLQSASLQATEIEGIAYTAGPGLMGALMVGAGVAHGLSLGWGVPLIGVHHLEGHLLAPMLEETRPAFPFIALLVSGGHTQLIKVAAVGDYELLGESLDDAAGEAFDKTAKLLGLPYPGGPELARLAQQGCPGRFNFPRPMTNRPGLDFSFSGLKTFARNAWYNSSQSEQAKADIAYAFEDAVVDTMLIKCRRAIKQTGIARIVMAGGVSANQQLRQRFKEQVGWEVFYPRSEFCTDNGAMIALAGALRLASGQRANTEIQVYPRWPLTALEKVSN